MEFYGYKKCSTCRNAYKYLTAAGIDIPFHDFVVTPPSPQMLKDWIDRRGEGVEPFINIKGTRYKELDLKDKTLSIEEWIELLSTDGKLLKRPVLVTDEKVIVGFKPEVYHEMLVKR